MLDPDDDIATVRTVRAQLATDHTRVIAIPPFTVTTSEVKALLLNSLGKKPTTAANRSWYLVELWLAAHQVRRVIVLGAHYLNDAVRQELCEHLTAAGTTIVLIYARGNPIPQTATLATLQMRGGRPPTPPLAALPLPEYQRTHPLVFRYTAAASLPVEAFDRVDHLLHRIVLTLERWLGTRPRPINPSRLAAAIRILEHATDPNERYIRHCGVEIALALKGVARPRHVELTGWVCPPEQQPLDHALTVLDPATAAYALIAATTNLDPDLIEMIDCDQLTDNTVLGQPIPAAAKPILRAAKGHKRQLRAPRHELKQPQPQGESMPAPTAYSEILSKLLTVLHHQESRANLPPPVRVALDKLVAVGALAHQYGRYTCSLVTTYSTYTLYPAQLAPMLPGTGLEQAPLDDRNRTRVR